MPTLLIQFYMLKQELDGAKSDPNKTINKLKQENGETMRLCIFLRKTTIVVVHFAQASPWLFIISITKNFGILCTFFSNAGQGLKLLIYHPKKLE